MYLKSTLLASLSLLALAAVGQNTLHENPRVAAAIAELKQSQLPVISSPAAETATLLHLVDSTHTFAWFDGAGQFENQPYNRSTDYVYDLNGNKLSFIVQSYDGSNWINLGKQLNTYDANGNVLIDTEQYWTGSAWENTVRRTYTYNANGKTLSQTVEIWPTTAWENSERTTYTYDINDRLMVETLEVWETNAWENSERKTVTRDVNGVALTQTNAEWDGNSWVDYILVTYSYDGNGNNTGILAQTWNGSWEDYIRYTKTFDIYDALIQNIVQQWNGSMWANVERYDYTNNGSNLPLTQTAYYWDISWVIVQRISASYDFYNLITSQASYEYDNGGSAIIAGDSVHYYYYTTFSGIADAPAGAVQVYPNPANDNITVERAAVNGQTAVKLYDVTGNLVSSNKLTTDKLTIDISALRSGVYFISVGEGSSERRTKIVKQ